MAPPDLPWLYRYQEDGPRLDSIALRPIVPVAVVGVDVATPALALVDSGSEHILAARWVAQDAGYDPTRSHRQLVLGIGGDNIEVEFLDVSLRLLHPDGDDDVYIEWQAEVGFVSNWRPTWPMLMGQRGFLDRFTVTFSRQSHMTAVEEWDVFDRRFGVPACER